MKESIIGDITYEMDGQCMKPSPDRYESSDETKLKTSKKYARHPVIVLRNETTREPDEGCPTLVFEVDAGSANAFIGLGNPPRFQVLDSAPTVLKLKQHIGAGYPTGRVLEWHFLSAQSCDLEMCPHPQPPLYHTEADIEC